MKIILLTSDYHISANIGVKTFLNNPLLKKHNIEICGLVSTSYDLNGYTFKAMHKFIRRSGWKFSFQNIFTNMWKKITIKFAKYFIPNRNREYFDIEELAKQHKIPFLEVKDINSEKTKNFIEKFKPDYLVSCFLMQLVKKEILDMPKKGAINVHPALVQKHRGTFSSFWTLLKNWQRSGATVHFMTEKPDEGLIVLQKRFFVHPSDTMHCYHKKSAILGANLLVRALIKLKRDKLKGFLLKKFGKLFTMPTLEEVKRFHSKGRSLIKAKDFFKV